MTESLCSCCKLFGKPTARINFLIAATQPDSLMYSRVKNLLRNYSENFPYENDVRLTDYETLLSVGTRLFNRPNDSPSIDQVTSTVIPTCCHGFTTMLTDIDDTSVTSQLDTFQKRILDLLVPKTDSTADEANVMPEPASWIMLGGSTYFEPALLNVFVQLNDQKSSLLNFSFTVLVFLVNEQQLFENWFFQDLPFEDYQSNTYPEYERRIKNFFTFLNSSKSLQENTLLINEDDLLTDNDLQTVLQSIFRAGLSKYRANNDRHRSDMAGLLSPCQRTIRDIFTVRNDLQRFYNRPVEDRLRALLNHLKEKTTPAAINAARQISHIVLDEFSRMNDEEKRVYKRQLMLGFNTNDAEHSNTIVAQLVHLALHLVKTDDHTLTSLIYSVVLVIRRLSIHFIFRHHLFNNTPEIFELSLLLISQRQYVLTLSGLRLCAIILNGDQIEHKYALVYLKHDSSSARKILDAIKWLLSPYIDLKNLWKEEARKEEENDDDKENEDSESDQEESAVHIAERFCFRHAGILFERSYISAFASLFYGSTDHCEQVNKDDIRTFAEVIGVLSAPRMACWIRGENKTRLTLAFISELCELLTPVLLYSSPSVTMALLAEDSLLMIIPQVIKLLLENRNTNRGMINTCLRFYTHFLQSKCKQPELVEEIKEEEKTEQPFVKTTMQSLDLQPSLKLSKDLISSYFDLHCRIQETSSSDEKSEQQEQIRKLLEEEWKKLDIRQLQHDYKQLNDKHVLVEGELSRLRSELQRIQAEKDQLTRENIRLAEEIDRPKQAPTISTTTGSQQSLSLVATVHDNQKDIIDDLKSLSPHEITTAQAEQCIQEIYRRRTTFNDPDMRKSICGSLKHLGSDLYSSPVHFLHELIQNAEDNSYANTVVPCLRIELDHSYILLSNNEQGLRTENVLAICSLAVSTKLGQQEQLGEKGVGFKSVFAASNQPMLMSHAWRFRFHVPGLDEMSYITPIWLTNEDIPVCISTQSLIHPHDTYLYLPLKLQPSLTEAKLFLNQVIAAADPCILLNMRHLKKLQIFDKRENTETLIERHFIGPTKLEEQSNVEFEGFTFTDLTGCRIKLCVSSNEDTFRVYTCYINIPNSIEQRRSPRARLILAFPCQSDYRLTSTVYTGLPVCDLGFNFLFNADFQLVTNRENVRENVPCNTFIRNHLAALFVYLLLNDSDLRKDIDRYCPSTNIHQLKHSSWWLAMIDDINRLITKYLSVLFGIEKGKVIRHSNADLISLVTNEQLYNCADIQVIDSHTGFLTDERLKTFQIPPVSIIDVLNCFPNREETPTTNEFRQQFRLQSEKHWWSQLFHHLSQAMTSEIFDLMLQKPIFLLNHNHPRQFLPPSDDRRLLLVISDDPSFQMWKRQFTLLQYSSESEKNALLKSNRVQRLKEENMIKIIRDDHLQLAVSSLNANVDPKLIEEIWKDLLYLKSRTDKLDRSTPLLVPVHGTPNLSIIQNAILPTIFGVNIRLFMRSTTSPIIDFCYFTTDSRQLIDALQWEYFLLQMNCQRPSICLPSKSSKTRLPHLPSFAMFIDEECARLGQLILRAHGENTKAHLQQFRVIAHSEDGQQISPISATFDENIIRDLPTLPRIAIPAHCRALAIDLGVAIEYDLRTCVTILQLLSDEKNTNVDLYIQWLGHLQLYIRQQQNEIDSKSLLASCQLYLPDQQNFYPLKDLLIMPDNGDYRDSIPFVSKYLHLQWISPSNNQIYWQFKELFRLLGCTCAISIDHICTTINRASDDKSNFFTLGDCQTSLTESGMETMIILLQYLEALILKYVNEKMKNQDLCRAVVENKHPTAPCGSRVDLEWRFSFTCNDLSKQLRNVIQEESKQKKISLPTTDRRLITKTTENIVYASLEMLIVQNLSKDVGVRHFISPLIARTCPLVLATLDIDYVERRGKLQWKHENHNLEYCLSQLSDIFRDTVDDSELEVIATKYARVSLLLSDSFVIDSINEQNENEISPYSVDTDPPFWIFSKKILLCTGYDKDDITKAIIATSALTTLLHKRQYIPFEEAKSIAQQKISACTAFRSNKTASVAGAKSSIFSYTDLLFPTDHQSIESMNISIGKQCTSEQDTEDEKTMTRIVNDRVAENRTVEDRLYRHRVQTQNHTTRNPNATANWTNPSIVDGTEELRIGKNAEHFFFTYLQRHYGTVDVTPTKNWRSSTRLDTYPQYRRDINDSAGFDFELHDTRQIFASGSKSTTKKCYFEVKGTSGSYNEEHTRFHVSQNESDVCQAIGTNSTRKQHEAYFIVIIENCLDPERISLGTMIDWSSNFDQVHRTVNSYQCRVASSSSENFQNMNREPTDRRDHRQKPWKSTNYYNNNSAEGGYDPRHHRNQYPSQQPTNANNRNTNSTQPWESARYNSHQGQYQPTNNTASTFTHDNRPPRLNQQRPNPSFYQTSDYNNGQYQQTHKK